MSGVSSVGSAAVQYKVPVTPQAKVDDERTESAAVKAKESATGKDVAVPAKTSATLVDVRA
jgi:hypothetical protein